MIKDGMNYLINTTEWFHAPDGERSASRIYIAEAQK